MMMMMMKVQRNNSKKKKPMPSTNLTRSATRRSPSFFINIGFSQPKMRIQVPKLLARTMQRRSQDHSEAKKLGKTLPKKVISILSSVFGSKKSKGSVSNSKSESGVGKEVEKMGWFKRRGKGSGKCVYCQHSLLKADHLLREPQKVGVVPTISRQESTRRLARVSSRVSSRRRVRTARSVRTKVDKEGEEEEDDKKREENNGDELCKKRILMGGKCKPVDFSESVDMRYFSGDRYWGAMVKRPHS